MSWTKKIYTGVEDPARFKQQSVYDASAFNWDDVKEIDVAFSNNHGGLATFGCLHDKHASSVAGIKVFNLYDDPVKNPQMCKDEYEILCKVGGDVAPRPYMIGSYDWPDNNKYAKGNECPAIVMELLPKDEVLSKEIKADVFSGGEHKMLPSQRVMEIGLSIAKSIAVCHSAGIVHRDLSPNNIFVHLDGTIIEKSKLIDFGSSTHVASDLNVTMGKRGTPYYASPEMCCYVTDKQTCPNGETLYSQRKSTKADIWSFGSILYLLYMKKNPHDGLINDDKSNCLEVKKDNPLVIDIDLDTTKPQNEYDVTLKQLILRCTKFYPENRPDIEEVIKILEDSLADSVTPPPSAFVGTGESGDLERTVSEFSSEFDMSVNEVYALLEADGRGVPQAYVEILNDFKWQRMSSEISKRFNVDEQILARFIGLKRDIPSGRFNDVLDELTNSLVGFSEALQLDAEPATPMYTVTYRDGLGGRVFADKVFSVAKGSDMPTPNLDQEDLDEQEMEPAGWDKPVPSIVVSDAEYTMRWRDRVYQVTYKDGFGGEVFADKVFIVRNGNKTPVFDIDQEDLDLDSFGYVPLGWSPQVEEFVDEDAIYTMAWERKLCRVIYHDGVDGEAFADKIYDVAYGSETPAPQLSSDEVDLREFGYKPSRWVQDLDHERGIEPIVTGDIEYTLLWREIRKD